MPSGTSRCSVPSGPVRASSTMLLMSVPPLPSFYLAADVNLPGDGRRDQGVAVFLQASEAVADTALRTIDASPQISNLSGNLALFIPGGKARTRFRTVAAEIFLIDGLAPLASCST